MLERAKARTPDRAQLRAGAQYGGFALKDDEAPLSVELEREAALSKKISALEVRRDARSEIWQVLARVVDNCEAFLRSAKQPLREHTPIEPKLQRGETPAAAIVRLRDRPNELRAELAAITSRSATLEIAKARLRDEQPPRGMCSRCECVTAPRRRLDCLARNATAMPGLRSSSAAYGRAFAASNSRSGRRFRCNHLTGCSELAGFLEPRSDCQHARKATRTARC
jgi:hypothetical protein